MLFAEYVRIRTETKKAQMWASKWGVKEAEVGIRRETREMELWQSRIRQIFLEFQNAAELLDDSLTDVDVSFYDFKNEIDIDKYQKLMDKGYIDRANAFSIAFTDKRQHPYLVEKFMFRYYRPYPFSRKVIPLELNHYDPEETKYIKVGESLCCDRIKLRYLYVDSAGKFMKRAVGPSGKEGDIPVQSISEVAQDFFDDALKHVVRIQS